MGIVGLRTAATVALLLGASASQAAAHKWHRHIREVPSAPSADSVALSVLAPASSPSTALVTYGDASIARAHLQSVQREAALAGVPNPYPPPYPCDPRLAGSAGYSCANLPRHTGYGQGYAFTPSYLSAPQSEGGAADLQTSILPPVTGLLWAVNGMRLDPH